LEPAPGAPDQADLGSVRRWVAAQSNPTAIDLFCGAGGLSLGLHRAGFSVLVGADKDPIAVETHRHNLGGLGWVGDLDDPTGLLETLSAWGIESVDLVAGGVPCQPFSRAGASRLRELVAAGMRSAVDPRAGLWRSFLMVVKALRPRGVLVENVPDLPRWNDGAVLIGLLEGLSELGYAVDARVLAAYEHGVPQHRARLFIVGLRDAGRFVWPEPMRERLTLRDAIGDLPPVPGGYWEERTRYLAARQTSPYQRLMRADLRGEDRWFVHDHQTRHVRPDDLLAYQHLAEGQTYKDLPPHLQRYRTDIFTDKYKRLSWSEPGRSITAHIAKDGYWYIHPSQHRTLSIREAARVQSFPDSFRFAGQPTHRFKQIGNAVPPLLAEAIGRPLAKALLGAPVADPINRGRDVRRELLDWYSSQPRHPWRNPSASPWEVLVGELCLGRATERDASHLFPALMRIVPDPRHALRERERIEQGLERLGLHSCVDRVLAVAWSVEEDFQGTIPDDHLALRCIPGVGDHTAQLVLCFGFGRIGAPLSQTTARVVGRLVGSEVASGRWQTRLDFHRIAGSGGPDPEFNAAFDALANRLCLARAPRCHACPLVDACAAGSEAAGVEQPELAAAA